jgi:hypothetical protein
MMLAKALAAWRNKLVRGALPLLPFPGQFTLTDLQHACEAILGHNLDKGVCRRQIKETREPVKVPGCLSVWAEMTGSTVSGGEWIGVLGAEEADP